LVLFSLSSRRRSAERGDRIDATALLSPALSSLRGGEGGDADPVRGFKAGIIDSGNSHPGPLPVEGRGRRSGSDSRIGMVLCDPFAAAKAAGAAVA